MRFRKNVVLLDKILTVNLENAMEKKITQENFEETYVDSIELERIDKFVCDEMARQIHRYIKAMKGSKTIMLKFEEQLATLTAIADS